MTRKELDEEIRETTLTLRHLASIGEIATAAHVSRYLDQLIETRRKMPALTLVKNP
jgi:chromosome segregation and condensation protein ScpB